MVMNNEEVFPDDDDEIEMQIRKLQEEKLRRLAGRKSIASGADAVTTATNPSHSPNASSTPPGDSSLVQEAESNSKNSLDSQTTSPKTLPEGPSVIGKDGKTKKQKDNKKS